jgi:hypothetical protein
MKTVAGDCVAASSRLLALISQFPNPPPRQAHSAQQRAATQKIAHSFFASSEPFCGHSFIRSRRIVPAKRGGVEPEKINLFNRL